MPVHAYWLSCFSSHCHCRPCKHVVLSLVVSLQGQARDSQKQLPSTTSRYCLQGSICIDWHLQKPGFDNRRPQVTLISLQCSFSSRHRWSGLGLILQVRSEQLRLRILMPACLAFSLGSTLYLWLLLGGRLHLFTGHRTTFGSLAVFFCTADDSTQHSAPSDNWLLWSLKSVQQGSTTSRDRSSHIAEASERSWWSGGAWSEAIGGKL